LIRPTRTLLDRESPCRAPGVNSLASCMCYLPVLDDDAAHSGVGVRLALRPLGEVQGAEHVGAVLVRDCGKPCCHSRERQGWGMALSELLHVIRLLLAEAWA
jgi:hypothetical protein